jgi:hypothetical protein
MRDRTAHGWGTQRYALFVILAHARAKLYRANIHIRCIENRVTRLQNSTRARIKQHAQFHTQRLEYILELSAFDDLALLIGDAIHNMRCALDYTWLQTIERLVPANLDERAKFPIRKTIEEVMGALKKGDVDTACPALFNFTVNEIKPCEGGNYPIWAVHSFDNRDKHRLLLPVLAQGHIEGIEVKDQRGNITPGYGISNFQLPPYVIDLAEGLYFTKYGKLTAYVGVEDGKSGCFMGIPDSLAEYQRAIFGVVEAFEGFLRTQGF